MSESVQTTMFPDLRPEEPVETAERVPEGPVAVARPPGWVLVATRRGPHGWHLVAGQGPLAVVVTVCGVQGRLVRESERLIVLCPACAEGSTV